MQKRNSFQITRFCKQPSDQKKSFEFKITLNEFFFPSWIINLIQWTCSSGQIYSFAKWSGQRANIRHDWSIHSKLLPCITKKQDCFGIVKRSNSNNSWCCAFNLHFKEWIRWRVDIVSASTSVIDFEMNHPKEGCENNSQRHTHKHEKRSSHKRWLNCRWHWLWFWSFHLIRVQQWILRRIWLLIRKIPENERRILDWINGFWLPACNAKQYF